MTHTLIPQNDPMRLKIMVTDAFLYNNERELLEIRLNILDKFVDRFVIMEATQTFSGKSKPLYFKKDRDLFKKWEHKIKYCVLDKWDNEEIWKMARESPNTQYGKGAKHWLQEFYIKEHLKDCLTDLKDDDTCFVGDVDEIWNPDFEYTPPEGFIYKLGLRVYTYYLNNCSSEVFYGTIVARYSDIKNACLNHLRTNPDFKLDDSGWHFTSMGGYEEVKRKLSDSYTRESYWTEEVENSLEQNIKEKKDFLGRNFTYKVDESEWPTYLKENREKYAHLLQK